MNSACDLRGLKIHSAMKNYTSAPLPFMGQKKRFIREFRKALREFDHATVFVDLFGGSGLLSHVTKRERPDARVIYNDFDDYHVRLENIKRTNALLHDIRSIVGDYPTAKRLTPQMRTTILDTVRSAEKTGYVEYITLSSSLLFSSKYVTDYTELQNAGLYNNLRASDYTCEGYLDGIEVVHADYRELFNQYKDIPGVVFLVDPPYLSTEVGVYKCRWRLSDYLDVLTLLSSTSYFYFTSNKSSIIELCEWISEAKVNANPFLNAVRKEMGAQLNYNSRYTDIMIYRRLKFYNTHQDGTTKEGRPFSYRPYMVCDRLYPSHTSQPSRKQPFPAPNPTPAGLLSYIAFSRVMQSQLVERAGRP